MDHSGVFTLREFKGREVLKLAPDAFIELNGAMETKVISPVTSTPGNSLDIRGGITSINITTGIASAGASTCNIEIIAPQYKGFHEDYYITLPSGSKIPFFIPMMEVKVYMKGRFLRKTDMSPIYYQVFWGFIKTVSESYSGGTTTFSLACGDMLSWWKYQTINLVPGVVDKSVYGGAPVQSVPTIFKDMNAFEIIVKLFTETSFDNFVVPQLSSLGVAPKPGGSAASAAQFGGLTQKVIDYWSKKYFFLDGFSDQGSNQDQTNNQQSPKLSSFLEMYGFSGKVRLDDFISLAKNRQASGSIQKSMYSNDPHDKVSLDFNILEFAQPFGALANFKASMTATTMSKLDVANLVSEQINFEFFLDVTGNFVFKPPFYNLDTKNTQTYRIPAKEILNFSAHTNSDAIITFLEVTGPTYYMLGPELEQVGFHTDFNLMARYGFRHEKYAMMYGNTSTQLNQIAVAEMGRRNGKAFTGNLSIPLRPEIRMGYPVYIEHIDSYYYVTGVNHSFTFGSTAQTDLILEDKRDRVYTEDGTKILKAQVYRLKSTQQAIGNFSVSEVLTKEEQLKKSKNITSGFDTGYFSISPATVFTQNSDAVSGVTSTSVNSNELVTFTDTTVPYTDINGYRHMGGFPYGANLKLDDAGRAAQTTATPGVQLDGLLKDPVNNVEATSLSQLGSATTLQDIRLFASGDDIVSQSIMSLPEAGLFSPVSLGTPLDQLQAQITKGRFSDALSTDLQNQALDSSVPTFSTINSKRSSTLAINVSNPGFIQPKTTQDLINSKIANELINAAPKVSDPSQ